jgi:Protein of unknown function (DUF3303)
MKFIATFMFKGGGEQRNESIHRFQKTGGKPPAGVTLLGRWTRVDFSGGFDLLESDDPKALTEFALMWSDLVELSIVPVLEDEALSAVLAAFSNRK